MICGERAAMMTLWTTRPPHTSPSDGPPFLCCYGNSGRVGGVVVVVVGALQVGGSGGVWAGFLLVFWSG